MLNQKLTMLTDRIQALTVRGEKRKKWILCFEFAKIGVEITII